VAAGLLDRVVDAADLLETAHRVAAGLARLDRTAHASTKARARHSAVNAVRNGLTMDAQVFADVAAVRHDAQSSSP
jgi:enoyl-CoA hydratase/carnithine racemase